MILSESETYLLWSICDDALQEAKAQLANQENIKRAVHYYKQQEALAQKLIDFLDKVETVFIEEVPF